MIDAYLLKVRNKHSITRTSWEWTTYKNVQSNCDCFQYDWVCEAVAYAKKAGLNPDKVLESISTGATGSWSLSN